MRLPVLAVVALFAVIGCTKDPAPAAPAAAEAQPAGPPIPKVSKWALDAENSSVSFVCKHVLTNVRGMFQRPTGEVTFDETTPANSHVTAAVDVTTITTGVDERDAHLKGTDFFDTAKYPTASFTSTSFSKTGAGTYSVAGSLTMHGVTKPVTLALTATAPFNHAGGIRRAIEASTVVNRRDFGLQWDFPGEGTGVVVGDSIKVSIDAELVLQP